MNIATVIGILVGIIVLSWSIIDATGNQPGIFWNPYGLAIVLGGVIAATFICYPLKAVIQVFATFVKALRREDLPIITYIEQLMYLAEQAMSRGTVKLEKELSGVENFFLQDALRMLIDQYPIEKIRQFMQNSIINLQNRELEEASIFRTMAKLSPAFGMVGTLIGLIVMFQNLSKDMDAIGPSMAVAMMSTFYGLILANLLFLPIAIKIERRINERVILMTMIMEGIVLIAKKTPPELVMDELKAFLPQRNWQDIGVTPKKTKRQK